MTDTAVVRAALLFGPFALVLVAWLACRPRPRAAAGIVFALTWNAVGLLAVNAVAVRAGWWSFDVEGGVFLDVPVDLLIGWSLLWTVLATLAWPAWHPALVVTLAVLVGLWLDVLLMPLVEPVVVLHDTWLVGEAVALGLCLAPSVLLARWTAEGRRLGARAVMHIALFTTIMLWVVPATILDAVGGGWDAVTTRPAWLNGLLAQLVIAPALLGIAAVDEMRRCGLGTPAPLDPPRRLVTSGAYAYVANPMQVSMCLVFLAWGGFLQSWAVSAAAAMTIAFGIGFGLWSSRVELERRFGARWEAYRSSVRAWWPTWRPRDPGDEPPARYYYDATCRACVDLARWIERREPRGLALLPADEHERALRRMTYERDVAPDAPPDADEGVVALARALEHVHLGWAFLGWIVRLPVVRTLTQLLADAVGPGPARPDAAGPRTPSR